MWKKKETPQEYAARKARQQREHNDRQREWAARQREHERNQREWEQKQAQNQREYEARQRKREQAASTKRNLIARANALSGSSDWKATGQAMKSLLDDWKAAGSAGKDLNDSLWSQFSSARQTFYDRRTAHFEKRQRKCDQAANTKRGLVSRASALSSSSDWKATGQAMKSLMDDWKAAGYAGKDVDSSLWDEFQSARQTFYDRRSAHFAKLDAERSRNKSLKEGVATSMRRLAMGGVNTSNVKTIGSQVRDLMSEWKSIGPVSKDDNDRLWGIMKESMDSIKSARDYYYEQKKKLDKEREKKAEYGMGQERGKNIRGQVISEHGVGTKGHINTTKKPRPNKKSKMTGHTTYHEGGSKYKQHFHSSGNRGESRTRTSGTAHGNLGKVIKKD